MSGSRVPGSPAPPGRPGRRSAVRPPLAAVCAVALLAGCSDTARTTAAASRSNGPGTGPAPTVSNSLQDDYERVVKNVLPSVVQITTGAGLGSGVVYDAKGDIVTNAHVVGGTRDFQVTLATGKAPLKATLVGSYPADDLAVIRLSNPPGDLRPATFGDASKVAVGQITLAMGNPLGLSSSVTQGIVSAVGRTVNEGGNGGGTGTTIVNMVQTSAAINPGNSGGALVNLSGQVIGIPTLAATEPELGGGTAPGIGFAIPVSTVKNIAGQLISSGKVTASGKAALNVSVRTVLNGNLDPVGAVLVAVATGGAADKAGLRPGDIVTRLDDVPVTSDASLSEALAAFKPGDRTNVTYERDGQSRTTQVTLGQL